MAAGDEQRGRLDAIEEGHSDLEGPRLHARARNLDDERLAVTEAEDVGAPEATRRVALLENQIVEL